MEWIQCHDFVLCRELLLINQIKKSNSLSFITLSFMSWFNKSIPRASLNEEIPNTFQVFVSVLRAINTQKVSLYRGL